MFNFFAILIETIDSGQLRWKLCKVCSASRSTPTLDTFLTARGQVELSLTFDTIPANFLQNNPFCGLPTEGYIPII